MSQRLYSFLVVFLLMFSGEIFGQKKEENNTPIIKPFLKAKGLIFKDCWNIAKTANSYKVQIYSESQQKLKLSIDYEILKNLNFKNQLKSFYPAWDLVTVEKSLSPFEAIIFPAFYTNNMGFFCKKELQFEKAINIPLRFRLGSLAYVNYMEQKPNAIKSQ
jgi:hypothetical protein